MSLILALIGATMSGYAMWLGWRIGHVAELSYNPEFLLNTFAFPLILFAAGLVVMGVAEALHHLGKLREQFDQMSAKRAAPDVAAPARPDQPAAAPVVDEKRPAVVARSAPNRVTQKKKPKIIVRPQPPQTKLAAAPPKSATLM